MLSFNNSIWIVNHHGPETLGTPDNPAVHRHANFAREFAAQGWNVTLFVRSNRKVKGLESIENISIRRFPTKGYTSNGLRRIVDMISFFLKVSTSRKKGATPDYVIGSTVHPLGALAGLLLARRHRAKFIYEVRDLWPETLIAFGALNRNGLVTRILRWLDNYLYKSSVLLLSPLEFCNLYYEENGLSKKPFVWIPNHLDYDPTKFLEEIVDQSSELHLTYIGSHGLANNLEMILGAAAILKARGYEHQVKFEFIGDGQDKDQLIHMARTLEIGNINFLGNVPHSKLAVHCLPTNVFLCVANELPDLYRYGFSPNKLAAYFSFGRPILLTLPRETYNSFPDSVGWQIDVTSDAMANQIESILKMPREKLNGYNLNVASYLKNQPTNREYIETLIYALLGH